MQLHVIKTSSLKAQVVNTNLAHLINYLCLLIFLFSGQIQIGTDFLQSSFSILEDQPMDMLLGLDMLKRHQVR